MIVRCTAKLLSLLDVRPLGTFEPGDDDWYLNLLWIERRKCVLAVHASTLFATFIPDVHKPDLRPLGAWLVPIIEAALAEEGYAPDVLGTLDPAAVTVTKTASRRVLGVMNDMAFHIDYLTADSGGLTAVDVPELNRHLRRTPYSPEGSRNQLARSVDLVAERIARGR